MIIKLANIIIQFSQIEEEIINETLINYQHRSICIYPAVYQLFRRRWNP